MARKVLIVDDDYSFANFARILLETLQYQTVTCFESTKAVETAKSERPDVILIDESMPGISGTEVIRRLKAEPATAKIPVLLCSITRDRSEISDALSLGALDYIPKPLNLTELQARLAEALSLTP